MAGAVASKTLLSFKRRLLLGKVRLKLFGGWLPETSGDAGGREPVNGHIILPLRNASSVFGAGAYR